jgi:hypothetical protein
MLPALAAFVTAAAPRQLGHPTGSSTVTCTNPFYIRASNPTSNFRLVADTTLTPLGTIRFGFEYKDPLDGSFCAACFIPCVATR